MSDLLPETPAGINHTSVQRRVAAVLKRIEASCNDSHELAAFYAEQLDIMLDSMGLAQVFGEGYQNDPRGDFRTIRHTDPQWSVSNGPVCGVQE
jgi:hypothetical protein